MIIAESPKASTTELPVFAAPAPEFVEVSGELPVSVAEALNGLHRALNLRDADSVTRCYVANRPGENAGLVIASVILEHDGYMRDEEILINDNQRNVYLGERAITWFGQASYSNPYDAEAYKTFMRSGVLPAQTYQANSTAA